MPEPEMLTRVFHFALSGLKDLAVLQQVCLEFLHRTKDPAVLMFATISLRSVGDLSKLSNLGVRKLTLPHARNSWMDLKFLGDSALTELNLARSSVGDAGVASLSFLDSLTRLDLTECDIGDEAVGTISQFSSLIELQLAATQITDTGVAMLVGLRLQKLNLGACRVSDRGLSAIASITSLSSLDLTCTPITDTALQAVGKLLNLQELFLAGCTGLTDTGLVALQPLCALQLLDLQWCDALTPSGVATALSSSNATIRMHA